MTNIVDSLKNLVKEKYAEIANNSKQQNSSSCCGTSSCCGDGDYTIFSENYNNLDGYNPDADLGLGCGIPTEFAKIKPGDTVIDLGSGAGNDCFVARALVGEKGTVIGVDFTEAMIEKARENADKQGYNNVEFRYGDIEKLPISMNKADVVISNCVLNLVPNKVKAFNEIYRVLKVGGHLSVSDVVLKGKLPFKIKEAADMYAGCVSGAIQMEDYLHIVENSGFVSIKVQKEKLITIPDDILLKYMKQQEVDAFKQSDVGIYSITVYAEKQFSGCSCGCGC
jgi:ubiquinone/menaquinone biosynthesis C-methylase UbiE